MKRGSQPKEKKLPPVKRTRAGSAGGGREQDSPGGSAPARKRPHWAILLAWAAAVIFLSSLLYLSRAPGPQKPAPGSGNSVKQKTQGDARPQGSAGTPAGSAREAGKKAESSPGQSVARPDSGNRRESPAIALERPSPAVPGPDHRQKTEPSPPQSASRSDSQEQRDGFSVALNKPSPAQPGSPAPPAPDLKPRPGARVSIVIDDFGQDMEMARRFASLPFPVTFSVLPHQPHSREIAEIAHSKGREVILHLPMEPVRYPKENPGKGALLLAMPRDEIQRNVRTALDAFPHFAGVNNHMGSRMTQNAEIMKTVIAELKERNLFFVDSWTTSGSQAWKTARELNVPTRKRDIFLDHDPSPASIRSQIARVIRIAKVQGTALAIGHPHQATLKSLQEAGAQFRKEGIEIVPARDLVGIR